VKKRVVITGLGPVTPIGIGKQPFWDALISGKSGAQKIHFDDYDMDQFSSKIACPINGFFLTDWIESSKDLKYLGRASQLALAGSKLALEDAGIEMNFDKKNRQGYYRLKGVDQEKCGIILGVGGLNADLYENSFKNFLKNNGPRKISPFA
jgi:3-oxoacyl-[acyl-carrier-protein] synthase II